MRFAKISSSRPPRLPDYCQQLVCHWQPKYPGYRAKFSVINGICSLADKSFPLSLDSQYPEIYRCKFSHCLATRISFQKIMTAAAVPAYVRVIKSCECYDHCFVIINHPVLSCSNRDCAVMQMEQSGMCTWCLMASFANIRQECNPKSKCHVCGKPYIKPTPM